MPFAWTRLALASAAVTALVGCNAETSRYPARAYAPIPSDTLSLMAQKGTNRNAPVLVRAYKKDSEIEIWKQATNGQYVLLKTYPVCRWSGQLGPKKREGDRQVPEGLYTVAAPQMTPAYLHAAEQYLRIAVDHQIDMVFSLENFCGHGFHADDPTSVCYRGPNTEAWFDLTCVHPNPKGHAALARLFGTTIAE